MEILRIKFLKRMYLNEISVKFAFASLDND